MLKGIAKPMAIMLVGWNGAVNAVTIYAANSAVASSEFSNLAAIMAIDQSGLSANYVSGVTDFSSFVATTIHSNGTSGSS